MLLKGVMNIVVSYIRSLISAAEGTLLTDDGKYLQYYEQMQYILRAFTSDTGASDQNYSDAQVLDTAAEGVLDGSLTCVEVDGTLALSSGKLAFTAQSSAVTGDLGLRSASGITESAFNALFCTLNLAANNKTMPVVGFSDKASALIAGANDPDSTIDWEKMLYFRSDTYMYWVVRNQTSPTANLGTYNGSTEYKIAIIPCGHDSGGVPYKTGDTKANFGYGSFYFIKGGAFTDWTMLWVNRVGSASTLYPMFSNFDASGTLSNLLIPDYDFSAVLQPILLDTFTDTDGTALADHTPDVCPVGSAWSGTGQITSNEAASNSADQKNVTIDCGMADFFIEDKSKTTAAKDCGTSVIFRYQDDNNQWMFFFFPSNGANNMSIQQISSGTWTSRGAATVSLAVSTYYTAKVICNGDVITTYLADANKLTYTSSFLNDKTKVGFMVRGNAYANTHDNFAVWGLTSSLYDSEFAKAGYDY